MQGTTAKGRRGSQLRTLISNPRISTFKRMSQVPLDFDSPITTNSSPGSTAIVSNRQATTPNQRVTVHIKKDHAPTLLMRFSTLNLPDPKTLQDSIKSRHNSIWYDTPSSATMTGPYKSFVGRPRPPSIRSIPDSINAVVEMASQFPTLPPLPEMQTESYSWIHQGINVGDAAALATILSSPSSVIPPQETSPPSATALGKRRVMNVPTSVDLPPLEMQRLTSLQSNHSLTSVITHTTVSHYASSGTTRPNKSPDSKSPDSGLPSSAEWIGTFSPSSIYPKSQDRFSQISIARDDLSARLREHVQSGADFRSDLLSHPEISDDESAQIQNVVTRKAEIARIKSVGNAPRKNTPVPTSTQKTRGSIAVELTPPSVPKVVDTRQRRRMSYFPNGRSRNSVYAG